MGVLVSPLVGSLVSPLVVGVLVSPLVVGALESPLVVGALVLFCCNCQIRKAHWCLPLLWVHWSQLISRRPLATGQRWLDCLHKRTTRVAIKPTHQTVEKQERSVRCAASSGEVMLRSTNEPLATS